MSSAVDEISIRLGVDRGDLKAALLDANSEIKTFGTTGAAHVGGLTEAIHSTTKAMRLFEHAIAAGGIIEAVKAFYEKAISYAEKHTEDTDAQTEAVRRFGEEMSSVGNTVGKVSVQVLGFLNQAGEGWGILVGNLIHGREEAERAREVSESAAVNLREIAKQHEETLKSIAEIDGKIATAEDKKNTAAFEQLTTQQKIVALNQGLAEQMEILATTSDGSLKHEQAKLQTLTWQALAIKTLGEEQKENAEAKKKADDYEEKAAAQNKKDWEELETLLQKQSAERKAAADAVVAAEIKAREEAARIAQAYDDATSSIYKTIDGVSVLRSEHHELTLELRTQLQLINDQFAAIARQAASTTFEFNGKTYGPAKDASYFADLSPAVLTEIIQRNKASIAELEAGKAGVGAGGLGYGAEVASGFFHRSEAQDALQTEIQRAQYVLDQVTALQTRGYSGALSTFAGPLASFDAAYQAAQGQSNPQLTHLNNGITAIAQTLNKVFPGQATPVPPTH